MVSFFSTIPSFSLGESLKALWESTGFMTSLTPIWQNLIMMAIAGVLIYLAIAKEFEPNLLLAIGFGMFIINIPGAYQALYGNPLVNESGEFLVAHGSKVIEEGTEGLFYYLYKGVEWVIYPPFS